MWNCSCIFQKVGSQFWHGQHYWFPIFVKKIVQLHEFLASHPCAYVILVVYCYLSVKAALICVPILELHSVDGKWVVQLVDTLY